MRVVVFALAVLCLAPACGSQTGSSASQAGRYVLFIERLAPGKLSQRVEVVDGRGGVVRMLAEESATKPGRGVFVRAAVASPDGRLVALEESTGLFVERISGSRPRLLGPWHSAAVWSPDSKEVLVAVSNGSRLAVVDVATGAERILSIPKRPHVSYLPVGWSGPAHKILFIARDEGGPQLIGCCSIRLVVASPTGSSPRTIYDAAEAIHDWPASSWSPDGKSIAFTTEGRASEDPRLAIVAAASGKRTTVGSFTGWGTPVWSPDSSRFAIAAPDPPVEIYSNRGGLQSTLSERGASPVAWMARGIYLVAGSEADGVKLLLVPTGKTQATTVFSLPRHDRLMSAQPLG